MRLFAITLYIASASTLFSLIPADASQQSDYPRACLINATVPDGLYANDDTDVNAEEHYQSAIALLLDQEGFAQLDCLADASRREKARFANGDWKLSAIYEGIAQPVGHATNEDWNSHLIHVQHWIATNPKSITARIAQAQLYAYLAWEARGNGSSDTVSDSGWKLFDERMTESKRLLEASADLKQCPDWYWVMQQVALAQGWPVAQQRALLEQAIAFEPAFYPYYRTFSYTISTTWYGGEGDSEGFAVEMADHLGGDDGDIIAFEVAAKLAPCCRAEDVIKRISWRRIQHGYAALEKRYGASLTNMNVMVFMATRSGDDIFANTLFHKIGEQWDKKLWSSYDTFEEQKKMTAQVSQMRERQLSFRQAAEVNLGTVAGARFKIALESKLHTSTQACIDSASDKGGEFQMLILLNKNGKVERAYMDPFTMVSQCLMAKLAEYYGPRAPVLLVPPQDAYWMKIDIDPALRAKRD